MLYIRQTLYKMDENESWKSGWVIGKNLEDAKTLLDENFDPVAPIIDEDGDEWMCYESLPVTDKNGNDISIIIEM